MQECEAMLFIQIAHRKRCWGEENFNMMIIVSCNVQAFQVNINKKTQQN
jgi:hypothetical protein